MYYYYIAVLIISLIVSYALRPRPQQPQPSTLADVAIPQIEIGRPVAVVFGEVWIDDSNIIWFGDLTNQPIYASGGKK